MTTNWNAMIQSYRGPSIYASCKILLYLVKWFQRRRFFRPTKNKILMFPYPLQRLSDKIIQHPLRSVRHFSGLMNYTTWSKSSPILLKTVSRLKVDINRQFLFLVSRSSSLKPLDQMNQNFKQFQRRRFFRNQTIRNKNCLWWPYLVADRDNISNIYRGPSIDAYYQVLSKILQEAYMEGPL
jgi:hypothetical protein